ncbi:hypothetical protein POJ06DRAFT_29413 [Lipomyces tetrasporus]|uniref:SUI1 domain-containing protein n=1 Tax=Lipomyces tetrasporus TaxID=54092 RepID=A0AAD7QLU3_9ASCO|nr:uncharacterized protein POJ06DRAFT_29413 [Lipomyces tetrasporus]KAJ8097320.1 hypothetical protein POJ06DRAFT_29413 [Lipomyces tetrasporus]
MFRKKPNIKPFSPVRSSDRRKLLASILSRFDIPTDALPTETKDVIFPADIHSAKFITHSTDETGIIYVGDEGNKPLWLKLNDDTLIPTVFTLWKCPFLLPIVQTWSPVIEKLRNGADMMLPGLIPPFPLTLKTGSIVAIASAERPTVPLAVGICNVDLGSITRVQGQHGKAILIIQCYGDELPFRGRVSVPLELHVDMPKLVNENAPIVHSENGEVEKTAESIEKLDLAMTSSELQVSPALVDDTVPVQEAEVPGNSVEPLREQPTTAEVDEAFRRALLSAIHSSRTGTALQFPQPSSTFISAHVLKHLPSNYASAQLKQTSWKKAAKFLKTMEKEGLVKIKEKGGDITIMGIAGLDNVAVKDFRSFKTVGSRKANNDNKMPDASHRDESAGELVLKEYYQINGMGKAIAEAVDKRTSVYYSMSELRMILLEYIDKEGLVNQKNPREIMLNPVLASVITVSPKPRSLPRESLIDRFREISTLYYKIVREGEDERGMKLSRGKPPKVQILIAMKQGHKITRITNLQTYKIDVHDLANELRTECASSTTVNKSVEGTSGGGQERLEIQVQGPQSKAAVDVLERHGVKKIWIEIKDNTKKSK